MNHIVPGDSSTVDIWPAATVRTLPSSAAVVSVISTSAADNGSTATGALTITIQGLDANYNEISEVITMDGDDAVLSLKSFLRVNSAFLTTAGSGQTNAGEITGTISSDIQFYIEANEGQSHQTMYTVPAGHTFLIKDYRWVIGRMTGSTDIQIKGEIMLPGSNAWRVISDIYAYGPETYNNSEGNVPIPAKSELRVQVISSGATECAAIFAGFVIEDNMLASMS
jgi:hypothetical protein